MHQSLRRHDLHIIVDATIISPHIPHTHHHHHPLHILSNTQSHTITLSASAMSALMPVEYTPINPYDAPAGLSKGPSMLNAVRTCVVCTPMGMLLVLMVMVVIAAPTHLECFAHGHHSLHCWVICGCIHKTNASLLYTPSNCIWWHLHCNVQSLCGGHWAMCWVLHCVCYGYNAACGVDEVGKA